MKQILLKTGLSCLGVTVSLVSMMGLAQDDPDMDRQMRELNIMDNIFQAAMEEEDRSGNGIRRIGRPDSMYLAGQGMVFSFRLLNVRPVRMQGQGFDAGWMDAMNDMLATTRESLARVQANFPNLDFDFDDDFDVDIDIDIDENGARRSFRGGNQAAPQAPQAPRAPTAQAMYLTRFFLGGDPGPEREAMREMEEAMRDTQEDIRDRQRDIRSMERDLRNADEAERDAIQARIDSLEADIDGQMDSLDEQRQAYEAFVADLQEARRSQQMAVAEEAADQIIATLCDYGPTLRSLADDEHVTIILEDVVDGADQVYVFAAGDISDCRPADDLKSKAVAYRMVDN